MGRCVVRRVTAASIRDAPGDEASRIPACQWVRTVRRGELSLVVVGSSYPCVSSMVWIASMSGTSEGRGCAQCTRQGP